MPELPEVEVMVRGIRPHLVGGTITAVRRCRCFCKPISITPRLGQLAGRLRGQPVTAVRRIAKRVVIQVASGDALVIEPRMTGLMLLADPPDREHLRLELQIGRNGCAERSLWFWDRRGLGTVRLYRGGELQVELGPRRLGPDALAMTLDNWLQRLAATRRPIKVALLDQRLVAGIGNLYASEILHRAGVHPARRCDSLKPREVRRLKAAVQEILHEAIRHEGSTLSDATYRNALSKNGRYQHKHRVYMQEHAACPTCSRSSIERIVQAQRSTFFCAACQK